MIYMINVYSIFNGFCLPTFFTPFYGLIIQLFLKALLINFKFSLSCRATSPWLPGIDCTVLPSHLMLHDTWTSNVLSTKMSNAQLFIDRYLFSLTEPTIYESIILSNQPTHPLTCLLCHSFIQ